MHPPSIGRHSFSVSLRRRLNARNVGTRDQRLRELTPSHEADVVPGPLLQIAHKLDGIPFHQFDARSVDSRERARENVGAHRRFLFLFRFRTFFARGLGLRG
jgi:hypothetical protein